ncbi:Hypothetical protein, putative [Bodo saltans]|uniref:PARP catalytic domain-containing protein n=1 Tax=Bodo saltans TaxID=75058 RepID=A0A0S4JEX2_BODSA|nr:Hypothetical protein, putative [Bodo saltans]|eukprot:CUG90136.1 Hypothetical protein, putative [Bodo saltans]
MWQVLFPSMMEEMGSSTSALKWYRSPERGERPPLPVFHDAEENSDSNQETKLWKRLCSMIEACWAQNSFSRPTMEGVMLDLRLLLEFRLQLDQASTASTKVEPTLWITQIWKPIFTDNDFFRTLTFSRAEGKLLSHFRCVTGDLNRGTYFEVALTDKMGMLANIVGMSYNEFILEHLRGSYGKDKLERCISKISKIVLIGVSDVRTRAFQMQRLAQRVSWEIGSSNGGDTAESDALRYLTKFHRICGPKTTQASPNEPSPVVLAWHGASVSELNALLSDGDLGDALVKDDHAGYFGYGSYFALEAEHAIRFVTPQPAAAVLYAVTYSRAYVVTPEKDYHVSTDQRFDRFSDFYHYNTETNEPSKVPLMQHCDAHIIPVKHYRRSEHPAPPRSQRTSGLEPAGPTTATTTTLTKHATAPPAAEPAATVKNNLDDGEELLCRENFQATREDEGRSSSPATTTYHEIVLRSRQQCIPIAVVYFTQQE